MESAEGAAEEYRLTLAELKSNNKTQINLLTILAEDYKEAAANIVDVIEAHLHTVQPQQKLTVMYVCDSIMKNVKKPNEYDRLFARKIVNMFEHVFRAGDEKVRSALYKLRVTWATTQVFIPSKLYQLDMRINGLDSAWPISNPRTGRALRDDPNVAAPPPPPPTSSSGGATSSGSSSGASGATSSSSSSRVFVNRKFLDATSSGGPSTSSGQLKKAEKTKSTSSSGSSTSSTPKIVKKEAKIDPLDKLLPTSSTSGTSSSAKAGSSPTTPKRKATPSEHQSAPSRKSKVVGSTTTTPSQNQMSSSASSSTSADEDLRGFGGANSKKDTDLRPRSLKPTSVVGSHAFAAPIVRPPPPPPPSQYGAGGVWTAPPSAQYHHNSPPQDPAPLVRGGPPPPIAPSQPPPPPAAAAALPPVPSSKNVYASEQTKLDVPANNRIFVDGKAYEVMFVDDIAVIERAGAPHRIYFAGPPRNLIVDGNPHLIPFDTPTAIEILGSTHIVKYGAPSRELYIGGHPFKGQFGGPPIVATINGRRHEIRLTGSAPEVRIEPEPAYHLTRFLHKMREEKKIEITAAEKPKDTGDWLAYLKGLQKSGILPPVKSSTPPPPPQQQHQQGGRRGGRGGGGRQNPPNPQWSGRPMMPQETMPAMEKRHQMPSTITDFNIRTLQIRYDSVVENLVTKRTDACKFCGMRLDDSNGRSKEWQDHMDWHVKQNLAKHDGNQAHYRLWYPVASAWLTDRASDQPNAKKEGEDEGPLPGVASSGVKAKECAVCQEKFDEYFDDDEETWRLRDTISVHGRIVHAACSSDATLMLEMATPTSSFSENPLLEVKEEVMETEETGSQEQAEEHDSKDFKHIFSFPVSSR